MLTVRLTNPEKNPEKTGDNRYLKIHKINMTPSIMSTVSTISTIIDMINIV